MMNSAEKVGYEQRIIDLYEKPEVTGKVGRLWMDYNKGMFSRDEYTNMMNELKNTNTDWFDVIFRPAISNVHSLAARGGNEKLGTKKPQFLIGRIRVNRCVHTYRPPHPFPVPVRTYTANDRKCR